MMNKTLAEQMRECGYCVSPNNIHGLQGKLYYAAGPGLAEPVSGQEIQVTEDRIRVFKAVFFGEQYSRRSFWDTVTVAIFLTAEELVAWCKKNGTVSQPGLPGFITGFD